MALKITGKRIKCVRAMTKAEAKLEGWDHRYPHNARYCPVIELEDGTLIYPTSDKEANSPGRLVVWKENENGHESAVVEG